MSEIKFKVNNGEIVGLLLPIAKFHDFLSYFKSKLKEEIQNGYRFDNSILNPIIIKKKTGPFAFISIEDWEEIYTKIDSIDKKNEEKALLKKELLSPFKGKWCPLFGMLPRLNRPKDNLAQQCIDIILKARHIMGINSYEPIYSGNNREHTNWPNIEDVPGYPELDLLCAQAISSSFSSIDLRATIFDGRDWYRDDDGDLRPRENLSQRIPEAIKWANNYINSGVTFYLRPDLQKQYTKKPLPHYKVVAILAILQAKYSFLSHVEDQNYKTSLKELSVANSLLFEAQKMELLTEKSKIVNILHEYKTKEITTQSFRSSGGNSRSGKYADFRRTARKKLKEWYKGARRKSYSAFCKEVADDIRNTLTDEEREEGIKISYSSIMNWTKKYKPNKS